MTQSVSAFINNPGSGTQYWGKVWAGCVAANGDSVTATVKAWTGANGTGSLLVCSNFEVWVWDFQANAQVGHFGPGSFTTVNAAHTATSGQAGHYFYVAAKFSGAQTPGSFEVFVTYSTSAAITPTTPTFAPAFGGPGTSVVVTGTKFTDATFCRFNGVDASSYSVDSDTQITAVVPTGSGVGSISVGNPNGSAASSSNFVPIAIRGRRSGVWVIASGMKGRRSGAWNDVQAFQARRSGAWAQPT
jgi:hypothetical protein